jgi:hypothetical protein
VEGHGGESEGLGCGVLTGEGHDAPFGTARIGRVGRGLGVWEQERSATQARIWGPVCERMALLGWEVSYTRGGDSGYQIRGSGFEDPTHAMRLHGRGTRRCCGGSVVA